MLAGGAVFGAAAAFDAGIRLQRDELRYVFAGDESEVLIAVERRDVAEFAAGKEDGDGAQDQVQVLGMRNERQKDQDAECMRPPEPARRGGGGRYGESGEIGDHQGEDEEGDDAGFVGHFAAEPDGADEEAADEEAGDADGHQQREDGGEPEVEAAEASRSGDRESRAGSRTRSG